MAEMVHAADNDLSFDVRHLVIEVFTNFEEADFDCLVLVLNAVIASEYFAKSSFADQIQYRQGLTLVIKCIDSGI